MSLDPRPLTNEEFKALAERAVKVLTKATSIAAVRSDALRPGFKFTEQGNYVLIDSAILHSEISQLLGSIITRLATLIGAEVRLIDVEYEFPDDQEADLFFSGLYMSIETLGSYLPNLKADKKPYELGKATGFFLRVRGETLRGAYKNVGIYGLKTCHRFFGNDSSRPKNEKERSERKSPLESYLIRLFSKIQGASDRYRDYMNLITDLFQYWRFQSLEDDLVTNIIHHYQKGFEDIRDTFERPIQVSTKKGGPKSKVVTGIRRPKRPNQSPTILNVEFKDFIDPIINTLWDSLEAHKRDFKENVRILGYKSVMDNIRSVYELRYEVTRNFSNLTTKRLQEARSYGLLSATSKKVDFNDTVRSQFFEHRDINKRVDLFVDEINKLIPEKIRLDVLGRFLKDRSGMECLTPDQIRSALSDKIAMAYPRANIGIGNFVSSRPAISATKEKEIRSIIDSISKSLVLRKTIPERLISLARAVFNRKNEVKKLNNFIILRKEIALLDQILEDNFWNSSYAKEVWKIFFACRTDIKEVTHYRHELVNLLIKASEEIKKTLDNRDYKIIPIASDAEEAMNDIISALRKLKV